MKRAIKIVCIIVVLIGIFMITSNIDHLEKVKANTNPQVIEAQRGTYMSGANYLVGKHSSGDNSIYCGSMIAVTIDPSKTYYCQLKVDGSSVRGSAAIENLSGYYESYNTPYGDSQWFEWTLYSQLKNANPTLTTTTINNQVFSEVSGENVLQLNGSVLDLDNGDLLQIKYSIDSLNDHQKKVIP
ncbi:hypothetical protein ACFSCX_06695 [Bacillus salitolerans]|uniref:Uncharacterized protein n=1 Tax=Bacillus salitolerans TaxID=1437434 RepID=A0ABW4LMC7_9BACI